MTIADKLNYLNGTKQAIKQAITDKGVEVLETDTFRSYANKIASIEAGSGSEIVEAYNTVSNVVEEKKVLLSRIGYTVPVDNSFSSIHLKYFDENGWAQGTTKRLYPIIDGQVDASSYIDSYYDVKPSIFFCNGTVSFGRCGSYHAEPLTKFTASYWEAILPSRATPNFDSYHSPLSYFGDEWVCLRTDQSNQYKRFMRIKETGTQVFYLTNGPYYVNTVICFKHGGLMYIDYMQNETISYLYQINTNENGEPTGFTQIKSQSSNTCVTSPNFQTKDERYVLSVGGYWDVQEIIDTNNFMRYSYPEPITEVIGSARIYDIQCFYDNSFGLKLNDGRYLMCSYTESIDDCTVDVIEPFIIEGDETVYHRTFSAFKNYWSVFNAPSGSNSFGRYNPKPAETPYLTLGDTATRWNNTVNTGYLTGESRTDENGRVLVKVRTALPK